MPRMTLRFWTNPGLGPRLALDAALLALLITALAFRALGRAAHEWVGLAFCLLVGLHLFWNRRWFAGLFRGRYGFARVFAVPVTLGLCGLFVLLFVCGALNSRHVFHLSGWVDGRRLRELHCLAAYWLMVLSGLHLGLHGRMILNALPRFLRPPTWPARGAALVFVGFGVWAFAQRDMTAKLFRGFSFDFWDPSRPLALLFACNLGIVLLFAVPTHYLMRLASAGRRRGREAPQTEDPSAGTG